MRWISEIRERLRSLAFRSGDEMDMEDELRFHVEMETEENLRRGMSPEEARRRALIAFGGADRFREEVREAWGFGRLEVWLKDVRHAVRGLRLNPLFTGTLVLTLALGVGATAAMFSIVDALLLRPLPYNDPDGLVIVERGTSEARVGPYVSWEDALVWRDQSGVFRDAMSHARETVLFTGGTEPRMLVAEGVTPNFEEVLGVRPALGRGFTEEDAEPGATSVVLLDHAFWRGAFGGDPGVVGRTIELEGARHLVIGVMPRGFKFPEYSTTEVWMPIRSDGSFLGRPARRTYLLARIGREPLEVVQARADAAAAALAEAAPREEGWSVMLRSMESNRARNTSVRQPLWFLAGAVSLLLIVSAVNAVGLLLMRGWSRSRELAVRVALGASGRRLMGQMVTESLILGLMSGLAATLLALVALVAVRGIIPDSITFFAPYDIELEWRTLVFTFVVATATGVLVGLVPALRATRAGTAAARAGLTPYAKHTPLKSRLRRALVVGEMALSVMLLIGAGLLIHSFVRLITVDPGFRVENLAVMRLNLSDASYPTAGSRAEFLRRVEEGIEALPGVEGVAINGGVPPAEGLHFGIRLEAEGAPAPEAEQPEILPSASVPPDFFDVLEVPIVAGRAFTSEDAGTDNVIIDPGLARFLWGDANPVGRRLRIWPDAPWLTVIGVVGDLRMMGPDDRRGGFAILYPLGPHEGPAYVPLGIRTSGDPRPLFRSFRSVVHDLDPRQPIQELRPATELYAESIDMSRFLLVLMSILSGLALLLAAVGIYGVLAFGVVQRRRELGIRIALGAPLARVSGRVMREGLLLATVGAAIGTAGALSLSRLIRSLLYGIAPTDPSTIAAVLFVSLAAAAAACYLPARRATLVDPVEVLRTE